MDYQELLKISLALLAIINPIGALPIFISITSHNTNEERKTIAWQTSLTVFIVLVASIFIGKEVLLLFGVTLPSFQVGGGILILLMAVSMLQGTGSGMKLNKNERQEAAESHDSPAVVPLGIPLLSGPGSIGATIVYSAQAVTTFEKAWLVGTAAVIALNCLIFLRLAVPIGGYLGRTGVNVIVRLMGLLLAAVAIEIIAGGLSNLFPLLQSGAVRSSLSFADLGTL